MTPDEVWSAVNAEVADMQRHIGGGTDPLAGFTPAQRTLVRIYTVQAWRLAVQREHDDLRKVIVGG